MLPNPLFCPIGQGSERLHVFHKLKIQTQGGKVKGPAGAMHELVDKVTHDLHLQVARAEFVALTCAFSP
jgi:hypothetical protein